VVGGARPCGERKEKKKRKVGVELFCASEDPVEVTFEVTRLGGRPSFITRTPPTPTCVHCNGPLKCVAQVYTPLALPHSRKRVVVVFGCDGPCAGRPGGWVVLRDQLGELEKEGADVEEEVEEEEEEDGDGEVGMEDVAAAATADPPPPPLPPSVAGDDWGDGGGGGWGDDAGFSLTTDEDLEGLLKAVQLKPSGQAPSKKGAGGNKKKKVSRRLAPVPTIPDYQGPGFPMVALDFCDEDPDVDRRLTSHEARLLAEYEAVHGKVGEDRDDDRDPDTGERFAPEEYESAGPDKVARKFRKMMRRQPLQCLRYDYEGEPLLTSSRCAPPPRHPPACELCGAERVFEFQIMSTSLYHLKVSEDGMDWGSILIYSCPQSCPIPPTGPLPREFAHVLIDI
jgi:hypothetical protein